MNRQLMSKFLGGRGVAFVVASMLALAGSWAISGVAGATTLTAPTISGTAQQGQTLTANPGTPGPAADTFDPPTFQWLVCTPTCANGPTGTTFPLTAAQVGATIEVTETINDTSVGATAPNPASATSAPTAAVLPLPPANTTAPSIAGIAQQGQILTANPGAWSPAATSFSYTWTSGGAAVGTNSQTYTVAPTDIGKTIAVSVIAHNAGGNSPSVVSAPTAAVLPLPPANTLAPVISGTAQQGQVLTVTPGTWANAPTAITHQWEDCAGLVCTPIAGQTGTSYTVGPSDVGHTVEVVEIAFNAAALQGVPAASALTATVSTTSTLSVQTFSQNAPSTNQAVTLVATLSSNSGNANPHGSLSFFNGSNAIPGCAGKGVSGGQTITIVCQASFGAGAAQVSAAYVADPGTLVGGSTSDTTTLNVGKSTTSISLAVTPKVAPGGHATYVATLGVPLSNAGPILPTGSIQFLDGGQPISGCASQALSNLTATCSVSYASVGGHSITVHYDGDPNFTGTTSSASGVQVVKGAPKAPVVRGVLGSTLGWKVGFHPRYSVLISLNAYAVAKGTSILIQCAGNGCPFTTWRLTKPGATVNLLSHFGHHHLRPGTRITVRLVRPNWVGKYYLIRIRGGHGPRITKRCLAPGQMKRAVPCPRST
jgi:hypothetical protein